MAYPAGWLTSCGHFAVGYEYGCNPPGFLRPGHHHQVLVPLRKGLRRSGGSDHAIAIVERVTPPPVKKWVVAEWRTRQPTGIFEVIYVHAVVKVYGSAEGVERGGRGEETVMFSFEFPNFYPL